MAPKLKIWVRPRASKQSMASASTPDDTIRVQQRLANVEISDEDDVVEEDEEVEEYDFSNEPEDDEDDEDDGLDTAHYKYPNGVMPISSDDEDDNKLEDNWHPTNREWRSKNFGISSRHAYETMFFEIPDRPMVDINGAPDWDVTEEYMRERDNEMLRYLEDYPLPQWVIAQPKAQDAYSRLLERVRWRSLGIRIYRSNNMPGFGAMSSQPFQSVAAQMPPAVNQSRHPSQSMPSPRTMGPPSAQGPQYSQMPNIPHNSTNGVPTAPPNIVKPPPNAVLPSQPNAQPMQPHPNGTPVQAAAASPKPTTLHSHSPSLLITTHGPTYSAHAHMPLTASGIKGKGREKTVGSPPGEGATQRIPTPPYEARPKPPERKPVAKPGRRNQNKRSEADVFPWNRKIDFKIAKINAVWDDSIYDEATLAAMAATRARNVKIIERVDGDETERQRLSRVAKKNQASHAEGSSDAEKPKRQAKPRTSGPKPKTGDSGMNDPHHSGSYSFATEEDAQRAAKLSKNTADDIMLAYEDGEVSLDVCAEIKICWNAGKKGNMGELEQVRFSVKDSILTREQIENMPILTHKSAERIVDFCPDLVWRDILLRIASEAGYGNKEIRDRMCHNGNYVDKATITKRIGAALGQKQLQAAVKNRMKQVPESSDAAEFKTMKEEEEYYNANVIDFSNYMEFFGHRTSHRIQLKTDGTGRKRKLDSADREESSGVEEIVSSPRKRTRRGKGSVQSPLAVTSSDEMTGVEGGEESDAESEIGPDAVSVQSDTMLDEMDED